MIFKNKTKLFQIITISITLILFLWGLFAAMHMPIYPDEPSYSLLWERFLINGGFREGFFPFCNDSFLIRPPFLLIPAAVALSIFGELFGENFYVYRIIPFFCWLVILYVLYANGRRYKNQSFWPLLLILLVGPTLYSLVYLRPEIVILTFSVLLFFWSSKKSSKKENKFTILGIVLFIFSYGILLYMHAKTIYLLPALVVAIIMRTKLIRPILYRITVRVFGISIIFGEVLSAIWLYNKYFYSCSSTKLITNVVAINPFQLLSNPIAFFENFNSHYFKYLWSATSIQISYENNPTSNYLPKIEASHDFIIITRCIVLLIIAASLIVTLRNSVKGIISKNDNNNKSEAILVSFLGLGLIFPYFLNLNRAFYDVSFLVVSIIILSCLSLPLNEAISTANSAQKRKLQKFIISFAFIFIGIFGRVMNTRFYDLSIFSGYRGSSQIEFSYLGPFNSYGAIVRKLLIQKGISSKEPLIVDDITYNMVFKHPILIPITWLGFIPDVNKPSSMELTKTLADKKIRFGITGCGPLPEWFTSKVQAKVIQIVKTSPISNDICIYVFTYKKIIKLKGSNFNTNSF